MISVYFVQHGAALAKDIDEKRPLSDAGADETRQVASQLRDHGVAIQKIVHSGKLRALQTALIFSEILDVDNVSELTGMKPNDAPQELIKQITEDSVMYIGHLPNIQNVVSSLITSDINNTILKFQNSAVACIEIHKDENYIKWFIPPNLYK